MPHYKSLGAISNPDTSVLDATENRDPGSGVTPPNCTPLNDPGSYVRDVKTKAR